MRKLAIFFCIIVLFSEWEFAQEQNQIPQEPIKKIETPNGSPSVEVAVVRGYLIDSDDESVQLLVNEIDKVAVEIQLQDIDVAYKWGGKNHKSVRKTAAIIGGVASGVTVVKIANHEEFRVKDLIDLKIPVAFGAVYGLVHLGDKIFNGNNKVKEIPFKMPFPYKGESDNVAKLAKILQGLEINSDIELVLKQ